MGKVVNWSQVYIQTEYASVPLMTWIFLMLRKCFGDDLHDA